MRYAVVGTGAIGGYYGGMLANADADVHFLFHSDYDAAWSNGLRVNSVNGDFEIEHINAYNSTASMPKADVILVGLKTLQNRLLPELLDPIVKEGTLIALIQNGIGYEQELQEEFPEARICGGLAFICAEKTAPAVVSHYDYGKLTLALLGDEPCDAFDAMVADMEEAGINVVRADDLNTARWKKLVWNTGFNGQSVLFGKNTEELLFGREKEMYVKPAMLEIIKAAQANGADVDESFADEMIEMTLNMKPYYPSMHVDYSHGRRLEVEAIYSRPLRLGLAKGVAMPVMEEIEKRLRKING